MINITSILIRSCLKIHTKFVSAVISKATKGFIITGMVYYFVVIVFARINLFFHKKCTGGMTMSIGVYVTAGQNRPSSVFGPVQQTNN